MTTCTEPGCNGVIQNGVCPSCGAIYDDAAPAAKPPATVSSVAHPLETGSIRSTRSSSVSARPASISAVLGASSKRSSRHASTSISTRRSLGAGLVQIAVQPDLEPLKLIRPDLRIPDGQRICSNPACVEEDGPHRGEPTRLRLDKGFCPKCRTRFSFLQVEAGTVVSGQYQIKGPIAIGGCGFVYLGWDLNVERYVVLKGLINSMDAAAMANAVKEKRFLSDLRDPSIVDIVNFVNHDGAQYIVMELVNGVTLKDIRKKNGALPITEAIAYTLGVLPAFEFLHSKKIVYCDFKIENAMVQSDRVRLIDLGGARRVDDLDSDMYLTEGYSAPEADQTVSYSSDLYTIGRTLAVLLMDFDFRGRYRHSLPTPQEVDLFARHESLYRFLLRATATNPDDRFQSASEMAGQLHGVLREVVAIESRTPRPAESTLFGMDIHSDSNRLGSHSLPTVRIDRADPAKALVESAQSLNEPRRQKQLFENAVQQFPKSMEAPLRLAAVCIELEEYDAATTLLDRLAGIDAYDWRVIWLRGTSLLSQQKPKEAMPFFDAVFSELPGELAPKLALAVVSEMAGERETAIRLYDLVSSVDPGYTTAAFGLARCMVAENDRGGAVIAFSRVPALSIAYQPALMQQVRTLIHAKPQPPTPKDLAQAGETLESVGVVGYDRWRLEADLFEQAFEVVEKLRQGVDPSLRLLGVPLNDPKALRLRAEAALRQTAKFAPNPEQAVALVDEANLVRPRTTF